MSRKPALKKRVLELLQHRTTPISSEDIAEILDHHLPSVKPRLTELLNEGLVAKAGQSISKMGSPQFLWVAVHKPEQQHLELPL